MSKKLNRAQTAYAFKASVYLKVKDESDEIKVKAWELYKESLFHDDLIRELDVKYWAYPTWELNR